MNAIDSKKVAMIFAAILGVLILIEALFARTAHPVFAWHRIPGHYAAIGLGASVAMILLCKVVGMLGLQRPEEHDREF